jgi:hypothetical protein
MRERTGLDPAAGVDNEPVGSDGKDGTLAAIAR